MELENNKSSDQNKQVDLSELLKNHSEEWVVLSFDFSKLIAWGPTFSEIESHSDDGVIMHVPNLKASFAPSAK